VPINGYALNVPICFVIWLAGVLLYATTVTDPDTMFWAMLANAMAYMPTIALSNSVSYSCLAQAGLNPVNAFPVRVFGTLGFIFTNVDSELNGDGAEQRTTLHRVGRIIRARVICFNPPQNPCGRKKTDASLASKLGLDAFVLFKAHGWRSSFCLR
jgi:NHS family xanthosine MFS transporter